MNLSTFWSMVKDTASDWVDDDAQTFGAALAYYTIFSIAPLLVIAVAVAGFVFGHQAAQERLLGQIGDLVGRDGQKLISDMVTQASKPGTGILATVLGVVMLLIGATGLFGELQTALNTIWEVQPKAGRGIWGLIKDRFLSFAMVFGTAFLLLVSLVISAALAAVVSLLGDWQAGLIGHLINAVVSFVVVTLLFAMIYRFLPDARVAWKDVWWGAVITAALFSIGKYLIGLYLGHSTVSSMYGAAGSLAVLLIWLYYSAQIFLFGAEFTKVYAARTGSRIVPAPNAQHVVRETRVEESPAHANGNGRTPDGQPEPGTHTASRPAGR